MRKEITGTLLFFLVVLILVSLASYNWTDPSINHVGASADVKNLFGLLGAHIAGVLIGLAGVGAFWIPVLLLIVSVHSLGNREGKNLYSIAGGGLILVFATGTMLAMISGTDYYILSANRFPAGGLVGTLLKCLLLKYTNLTGGLIIIGVAILIGLILSTGFSFIGIYQRMKRFIVKNRERWVRYLIEKENKKSAAPLKIKINRGMWPGKVASLALAEPVKVMAVKSEEGVPILAEWTETPETPPSAPLPEVKIKGVAPSKRPANSAAQGNEIPPSSAPLNEANINGVAPSKGLTDSTAQGNETPSPSAPLPEVKIKGVAPSKGPTNSAAQGNETPPPSAPLPEANINGVAPSKEPTDSAAQGSETPEMHPSEVLPEVKIKSVIPKKEHTDPAAQEDEFSFMSMSEDVQGYQLPTIAFLMDAIEEEGTAVDAENLRRLSLLIETKLEDFGVRGTVSEVSPGPVITTFEYKPAPGVKINKIVNLTDDLALALCAISIRIVAPIPGKDAIGIEVPNEVRSNVYFKEIVTSSGFINSKSPLCVCLGHDIVGRPISAELNTMPHLLIAGATGAGKSVGLNAMIASLLFKSTPDDVRMIMIDPKRIELSVYNGIPHLITPVVTDMKKATNALFWAVREMERRYELLAEHKMRNIDQYNKKVEKVAKEGGDEEPMEKLPFIVIIIDELADLMMVASRDVEVALTRLAQMARASGIHIVLATQRPSVDVLTGIIKANFPTRISFQVSSKIDSRTIIDSNGAETLLGRGDMLYLPPGTAKLMRIHGAFISDEELEELIDFWKEQQGPGYDSSILEVAPEVAAEEGGDSDYDARYDEAVALVTRTRQASISSVQRHLRVGYNRAARIIEAMERDGVIGPADGSKSREILVASYDE